VDGTEEWEYLHNLVKVLPTDTRNTCRHGHADLDNDDDDLLESQDDDNKIIEGKWGKRMTIRQKIRQIWRWVRT
jgi:hypothetical protein